MLKILEDFSQDAQELFNRVFFECREAKIISSKKIEIIHIVQYMLYNKWLEGYNDGFIDNKITWAKTL